MADNGPSLMSLRLIADLSQHDIAERMNVSTQAVSQLESRDFVRDHTADRYRLAVVAAVREQAAGRLIVDAFKSLTRDLMPPEQ
jgi:transcriptional regulator with XRE-family HTH domain